MALGSLTTIEVADLPSKIRDPHETAALTSSGRPDDLITLDEVERRYIRQVLLATKNNKTDAARILGIDRRSLYRRLHERGTGSSESPAASGSVDESPTTS